MSKPYPLVIEELGGDDPALFSRGHHDPMAFLEAARLYAAREGIAQDRLCGEVKHAWWRYLPDPEYGCLLWGAKGPGRGAFPATEIEVQYPARVVGPRDAGPGGDDA